MTSEPFYILLMQSWHEAGEHEGSFSERREGETDPHNQRQGDGRRPHKMENRFSHSPNSRKGDQGYCYGETPCESRCMTEFTGDSDTFLDIHVCAHTMG